MTDIKLKLAALYDKRSVSILTISVNIVIHLTLFGLSYNLIPWMMNYNPSVIQFGFDYKWLGITYTQQYLLMTGITLLLSSITIYILLRDFNHWRESMAVQTPENKKRLERIKAKCIQLPTVIGFYQNFIVTSAVLILNLIMNMAHSMIIMVVSYAFCASMFMGSLMAIITKKIFYKVLVDTFKITKDNRNIPGRRVNLLKKSLQLHLPMVIASLLSISLVAYSRVVVEKGNALYIIYRDNLDFLLMERAFEPTAEYADYLKKNIEYGNNETVFWVDPNGTLNAQDNAVISQVFSQFIQDIARFADNRVYDVSGSIQGVIAAVPFQNNRYIVGIQYNVVSVDLLRYLLMTFVLLILLDAGYFYFSSKSITNDLGAVAKNITEIALGKELDLSAQLAVTSLEEVGEIVTAFYLLQKREKDLLADIQEQQDIIIENERLISLGHLISGIAHNLRTPIMSISAINLEIISLADEYKRSISDKSVTKKDHEEISAEILDCAEKIGTSCAYMSDVIDAVRGQAMRLVNTSDLDYTVEEVLKYINILMTPMIQRHECWLEILNCVSGNVHLHGDLNSLVQVISNVISNAVEAYAGKGGAVYLTVTEKKEDILFQIIDKGDGISDEVSKKIFKQMVTTKGKNGTGLGIYLSYATIKGKFEGKMWFETEVGVGTIFYISIPRKYC